jgi:hypothetical protein
MIPMREIVDRLPFDVKAESLVVELLLNGEEELDFTQFMISPLGPGDRRVGKEVKNMYPLHSQFLDRDIYILETARYNIADHLPIHMIYDKQNAPVDEVEKAEYMDRAIKSARMFFRPFHQVMAYPAVEIEYWERMASRQLPDSVVDLWELREFEDILDDVQYQILLRIIPAAPLIVGDWKLTALALSLLLDKKVDIEELPPEPIAFETGTTPPLGKADLGVNFVVGDTINDRMRSINVKIYGIEPPEIEQHLPGKPQYLLITNLFFYYLISIEIDWKLHIFTHRDPDDFTLSSTSHTSILGYTTNL